MRWDPYVLARGPAFEQFWAGHAGERSRKILLVLGRGFDGRALEIATRLIGIGAAFDVWLLEFDQGLGDNPRRIALRNRNEAGLTALVPPEVITRIPIAVKGPASNTATSGSVRRAIADAGSCAEYDDVVVDISAMPRMIALSTVAKLLHDLDQLHQNEGRNVNLHVATAESVSADVGYSGGTLNEEVSSVVGFSGQLAAQGSEHVPRVWFPVLGEGQRDRLSAIQDKINPDEICPVIPFPTREPRRGDEIIEEHREILFDEMNVEPKNILLACEYNPFEAYKQIFMAMERYARALGELGGCKAFVSPLSSKLLSIGALLACYDHQFGAGKGRMNVGIPYVETADYGDPAEGVVGEVELYSMWIRGEWEE